MSVRLSLWCATFASAMASAIDLPSAERGPGRTVALPAGTEICRDAETVDRPMERCFRVKRRTRAQMLTRIPGISVPAYLVQPDGELPSGFIRAGELPE